MVNLQDLEVPEEVFENSLISLHLKCMRSFGYIVSKQQQNKRFHLSKGAIFIASCALFCCLIFIKISEGFTSLAQGAISCATALTYLAFSIATANAFFQRKRVVRMVKFLHKDMTELFAITDTEEKIMLAKTIKYLRITLITMWMSCVIGGIVVTIDCFYHIVFISNPQTNLLFQLYPFGLAYDNLIVGYCGAFYAMFLGIATIPCWHTFVTCLMKYIILKYAVINKRLRNYDLSKLGSNLSIEEMKSLPEKDLLYWHTKMCEFFVREQIELRWFSKELESLIRIPVFLDFIIFSVLICFLFYATAAGNPSNMDYFFYAIYIFVMSFILWLYHWNATLITDSNDKFRYALYSCPWYSFPIKIQKNIRLMMMESTQPLTMKAIFVELNLKTFIDVVRGAYSYFSILRNASLEPMESN